MVKAMGKEKVRSARGGKVKMRMVKEKSRAKSKFVYHLSLIHI